MNRRIKVLLISTAMFVGFIGILVYLIDRQPGSVYLLADGFSIFDNPTPVFGKIGYHLPTFIHVYVFILLSAVVVFQGARKITSICLTWFAVDSLFEISQSEPFASWIAGIMPGWFTGIPILENTADYFLAGTFDVLDLVSIAAGTIAAYLTVIAYTRKEKNQNNVLHQPTKTFHRLPIVVLVSLAFISTVGSVQSGGEGDNEDYSISWVTVNSGTVNVDSGDTSHVYLYGEAFVNNDYVGHTCIGLECLFGWFDDSYPGVDVTWQNLTTGTSGSASSRYGTATSWRNLWSANADVTEGVNSIRVTAADPAGNMASEDIIVVAGPDIFPPTVVSTAPADGASFVSLSDPVAAWFSESLDPATVDENSFLINSNAGDPISGVVTVSESGTYVTFSHAFFEPNTIYRATVTTAITDRSGKPLNENYEWAFSTGEGDYESPTVTSTVPLDNSVDVSIFNPVTVTFSELMDHATITADTFTVLDNASNRVDGAVSTSAAGSFDITTFTPDNPLVSDMLYTISIDAGVADLAANTLGTDYAWSFTTASPDTTPPTVVSVDPVDSETCVALDRNVSVTFNENMDASTLNDSTFLLTDLGSNPVIGQIFNTATTSTFNPYGNLSYGADYLATITTGAKDLSGNSLSTDYSWTFLTEIAPQGSWTPMSTADVPSGRAHHTAVWSGSEMIIWGGGWNNVTNTGGRYNPTSNTWQPTSTINAPSSRYAHTAVWTGEEMVIWGGDDYQSLINTGGRYNPATNTWQAISNTGAPSPRRDHVAVWTGSEMIVWGGSNDTTWLQDGARYNPSTDTWQPMTLTNAPRYNVGYKWLKAVWTGSEMMVISRYNFNLDNGARYDPAADTWQFMSEDGAPAYSTYGTIEAVVWTGTKLLIWGRGFLSAYDPALNSWSQLTSACSPAYREYSSSIWTGSEMIVWGGFNYPSIYNTGGSFQPSSDLWSSTTLENVPSPRLNHTAVWTGIEMLLWGGISGTDSGGIYKP